MKLVGFNFTKISAEKLSGSKGEKVKVNTNIDISKIEEVESEVFRVKDAILGVRFKYDISYDPDFALIRLEGNFMISADPKLAKTVLNDWKDKKLPGEFEVAVFNIILRKSNVKAIQLEDELNLPLHISLPSLKKQA